MTGDRDFIFGRWVPNGHLTTADVPELLTTARMRAAAIAAIPVGRICAQIGRLRALWTRSGRYRDEFLRAAPERSIGWSRAMIECALDAFAAKLDERVARRRIASQLGDPNALDGFVPRDDACLHAAPLGVILHIVSGNVFFGPAESLLTGLLAKSASFVKRPTAGAEFLLRFVDSLAEAAPELASSVAVLGWRGGHADLEASLAAQVDAVLVAGGPDVIASYRRRTGADTALIEFGPRASVAVLSSAGAATTNPDALARDVALWEQFACTNAQCVYVEGRADAMRVADDLASALERVAVDLPEGDASLDERIEVARFRDMGTFAEALGTARLHTTRGLATVLFDDAGSFEPSPLRRCVRVKPFEAREDLRRALLPLRGLLQTVGLAADGAQHDAYERMLVECGARRVCDVGCMNTPPADGLHDGTMELHRLVRWVQSERRQ